MLIRRDDTQQSATADIGANAPPRLSPAVERPLSGYPNRLVLAEDHPLTCWPAVKWSTFLKKSQLAEGGGVGSIDKNVCSWPKIADQGVGLANDRFSEMYNSVHITQCGYSLKQTGTRNASQVYQAW
jgi:hypothetical protein